MSKSLKYPHDRVNEFVQLKDGNGNPYVPDFIRSYNYGSETGNAIKYAGAFLALSRRLNNGLRGEENGQQISMLDMQ